MKIIEGLKKVKDLQRKADDIRKKIRDNCADLDNETPTYETETKQREQIKQWLQSHSDILKEIIHLKLSIQNTNLNTIVPVQVEDGKYVEKSIAYWIQRRDVVSKLEVQAYAVLTNRNLQPMVKRDRDNPSNPDEIIKVRRYYDQKLRDEMVEKYTSEPVRITAALEITNATKDLLEI